jgi:hypothetical protein
MVRRIARLTEGSGFATAGRDDRKHDEEDQARDHDVCTRMLRAA